jgi:hypothetical protein
MTNSNRSGRPRRRALIIGLGIVAAVVATASLAVAAGGGGAPDGSSSAAPAPQVLASTSCGPRVQSIVRTENAPSTTSSTAFVTVPGAVVTVSVPAGATRCIKVLFTAETACRVTTSADFCYVRALDNGVEMNPQGASFQAIDSEKATARGHAFEWVRRVAAGSHTISLQRRVNAAPTVFTIDDWTFDVQVEG